MGLFSKRKKEKEEETTQEAKEPEISGNVGKDIELMNANINKLTIQIESLNEVRRSTVERFAAITEQIGELRGQLMDTNKSIGIIEVKATKAADLVEAVHPDKLMIEVQKLDGKIEATKANIESNEAMMHNLMDQIKKMRNQMAAYRGIEQVLKMNQEAKEDILNIKKMTATVEKHSDKVESIFADMQRTYHEYNIFSDTLNDLKKEFRNISKQLDTMNSKLVEYVNKKDFEKKYADMQVFQKHLKKTLKNIDTERKQYRREFDLTKKSVQLKFEKEFAAAKVMSGIFERLLITNPQLASDLHLKSYIEKRKHEIEEEENKPLEEEEEESKEEKKGEKQPEKGEEQDKKEEGQKE